MKVLYPAIFSFEDGCYNVEFPDLKGCLTYGDTIENAFANAQEALAGYSASVLERGLNLPPATSTSDIHLENGQSIQLIDVNL